MEQNLISILEIEITKESRTLEVQIVSVEDGVALIEGLENAQVGELVEFIDKQLFGMVLNLDKERVGVLILADVGKISQLSKAQLVKTVGKVKNISLIIETQSIQYARNLALSYASQLIKLIGEIKKIRDKKIEKEYIVIASDVTYVDKLEDLIPGNSSEIPIDLESSEEVDGMPMPDNIEGMRSIKILVVSAFPNTNPGELVEFTNLDLFGILLPRVRDINGNFLIVMHETEIPTFNKGQIIKNIGKSVDIQPLLDAKSHQSRYQALIQLVGTAAKIVNAFKKERDGAHITNRRR